MPSYSYKTDQQEASLNYTHTDFTYNVYLQNLSELMSGSKTTLKIEMFKSRYYLIFISAYICQGFDFCLVALSI